MVTALRSFVMSPGSYLTRLPDWAQVLGLFVLSRLVVLPAYVTAWHHPDLPPMLRDGQSISAVLQPGETRPGFVEFLGRANDAGWYGRIAEHGYPAELPRDSSGAVEQNVWAFFPLFPLIARFVMSVTGLSWDVVGVLLAMACALAALLVLHRLVHEAAPEVVRDRPYLPILVVAAVCFFPSAGTFSVPYTESMALLLIVTTLLLVVRRRYALAIIPIVLLAGTRAVVLPMAVVLVWHLISRHRHSGSPSRSQWAIGLTAAGVAAASSLVWPAICARVTDTENAYFLTQSAWRHGNPSDIPFAGWFGAVHTPSGLAMLLLVLALAALVVVHPVSNRLGPEIRAWAGAYAAYLVAVTVLWTSVLRFLLLDIGLQALAVGWIRRFRAAVLVLGVSAALQYRWVYAAWSTGGWAP